MYNYTLTTHSVTPEISTLFSFISKEDSDKVLKKAIGDMWHDPEHCSILTLSLVEHPCVAQ